MINSDYFGANVTITLIMIVFNKKYLGPAAVVLGFQASDMYVYLGSQRLIWPTTANLKLLHRGNIL